MPRPELGTAAEQDYVKAIFRLEEQGDATVSTTALAERLGVTPASASGMVRRLAERGLVTHVPYRGVTLTRAGAEVALRVIRRHRLLETYLVEELGMPWDRVHQEAEVLEHVLSSELEALIARKLGDPVRDPHGDPIPSVDLEMAPDHTVALSDLPAGAEGAFVRISDSDPAMLRYLAERGIAPGDRLVLVERQPFGGPLFVRVGGRDHALGGALADAMRIEVGAEPHG